MTKSIIPIPGDARTRHTSQSYATTYGGKAMETGADGYDSRILATYAANFQITVDVSAVATYTYILPPLVYSNKHTVIEGGGGSPVAAVSIEDLDGTDVRVLVAAMDLSAPGTTDDAYDLAAIIDPENVDQRIVVDVTTAGTGFATFILRCDIVATGWK